MDQVTTHTAQQWPRFAGDGDVFVVQEVPHQLPLRVVTLVPIEGRLEF